MRMSEIERLQIENGIVFLVEEMLEEFCEKHGVAFDGALDAFTRSDTYLALYNFDTALYREGPQYLMQWYEEELANNNSKEKNI